MERRGGELDKEVFEITLPNNMYEIIAAQNQHTNQSNDSYI